MLIIIISAIIAYLLGSINTSIVISHFLGDDIRNSGSGNAGATNTLRTYGKKIALFVVLGDALKGIIVILIARLLCGIFGEDSPLAIYAAALFVILGHNFPLYFGFKGGKGILTSITVVFMLDWRIGLILLAVSVLIMALTRYVSLGSCIGSMLFVVLTVIFHFGDIWFVTLSVIMCVLALWRHKENIKRLINRTESKIGR